MVEQEQLLKPLTPGLEQHHPLLPTLKLLPAVTFPAELTEREQHHVWLVNLKALSCGTVLPPTEG